VTNSLRGVGAFLREVVAEWQVDDALSMGAALAYYAIFSMAPLLILVIAIAGLVLGQRAAEGELVGQISGLVGASCAQALQEMIARASSPKAGVVASVVSVATIPVKLVMVGFPPPTWDGTAAVPS